MSVVGGIVWGDLSTPGAQAGGCAAVMAGGLFGGCEWFVDGLALRRLVELMVANFWRVLFALSPDPSPKFGRGGLVASRSLAQVWTRLLTV